MVWILSHYRLVAVGVAIVAAFGAGYRLADQSALVKRQQTEIILLRQNQDALANELMQRVTDNQQLERYKQLYEDGREALSHPDNVCFDESDTVRVQHLWH